MPLTGRHPAPPSNRAANPRQGTASLTQLLPIALLLYSTLLPQEVRISIAGQVIFPYRAVTFLLLPWMLTRIISGRVPFRLADLWMFATVTWMVVSFVVFYGLADGISRGGALAFDMIAPYLIARISIGSFQDLRRFLVIVAPGLLLAGASMMLESVSHRPLVRPIAASIFGPLSYFENGQAVATAKDAFQLRLGLLRAAGPFSHPILAGLFMASFLPLYFNSSLRKWPYKLGMASGLFAIFSISSAAFLSFIITGILQGYEWLQDHVRGIGWRFFIFVISAFLFAIQMASQNGLLSIIIRYTLDPQTGRFRQLIWEYGFRSVAKHPWFGIGFTDYERLPWMVNSIDNHWLLLGIRHGYIAPVCLMAASLGAIYQLSQASSTLNNVDSKLARGVVYALVGLVLSAFTTSYFGGILTWFIMLIGIAFSLSGHSARKPF